MDNDKHTEKRKREKKIFRCGYICFCGEKNHLLQHLYRFGGITIIELKTKGVTSWSGERWKIDYPAEYIRRLRIEGWIIKTETYREKKSGKARKKYVFYGHSEDNNGDEI